MAAITASCNTHHEKQLPAILHCQLQNFEYNHHPNWLLHVKKKEKLPAKKRKLSEVQEQSNDDVDLDVNVIESFSPSRYPGPHIDRHSLCTKSTALDFSFLYFD